MKTGFVWHDLMTTDVARATTLLTELFGWSCTDHAIRAGDRTLGLILPFAAAGSVGSHWVPYVAVGDLDAFCREATSCGATLCVQPTAHPAGGRFAFLTDPQRAFFSALEGGAPVEPSGAPGTLWHAKLLADDLAAASAFYGTLLGWEATDRPGPGWMIKRPPVAPMPLWLPHVVVEDVGAVAQRAQQLGAFVAVPPKHVAGIGTYTVLGDSAAGIIAAIAPEWRHAA